VTPAGKPPKLVLTRVGILLLRGVEDRTLARGIFIMWQYGNVAAGTVGRVRSGACKDLCKAWDESALAIFPDSASLREKVCPRTAFFGLCEEGLVRGIPPGVYNSRPNSRNKGYAVRAVLGLASDETLAQADPTALWRLVKGPGKKRHNSQMHVVLTLWRDGLINRDRARQLAAQRAVVLTQGN
jgi:hypothetical protein